MGMCVCVLLKKAIILFFVHEPLLLLVSGAERFARPHFGRNNAIQLKVIELNNKIKDNLKLLYIADE